VLGVLKGRSRIADWKWKELKIRLSFEKFGWQPFCTIRYQLVKISKAISTKNSEGTRKAVPQDDNHLQRPKQRPCIREFSKNSRIPELGIAQWGKCLREVQ
jgi:hypothetical protein